MSLPDFYQSALAIEKTGKYPYGIAPAAIAVAMQESHGVGTFLPKETDYLINLHSAIHVTGISQGIIQQAFTIKTGTWIGKIAKFRFEPSYWNWVKIHELTDKGLEVVMASSIGIGQQMMRWYVGEAPSDEWQAMIDKFAGSLDMQMAYLCGNLAKLLAANNNDLFLAYKAYNSGNAESKDELVISRAERVVGFKQQVMKELGR